eukprot:TRINITY_DN9501_c0_g1_i1.p1 TRINITY_DN9501_c0_g1~~TRINITY_DN9501_c0_g1_i1.p1  ORF type:complete len:140 (-),score=2.28 TRINITY_DN9501_c0_g1_i1:600-1019(-)
MCFVGDPTAQKAASLVCVLCVTGEKTSRFTIEVCARWLCAKCGRVIYTGCLRRLSNRIALQPACEARTHTHTHVNLFSVGRTERALVLAHTHMPTSLTLNLSEGDLGPSHYNRHRKKPTAPTRSRIFRLIGPTHWQVIS